jgi:integrase
LKTTNPSPSWTLRAGPRISTTSKEFRAQHVNGERRLGETKAQLTSDLTFGQWLDEWLDLCAGRGLRPSTVASYRTMVRLYVEGALAATTLPNVTARDLNGLYTRLLREGRRNGRGGLSARTVRYLHTVLNKALADAVRVEHILVNPGPAADPPSPRATRAPIFPVWSPAELARFLESAKHDAHYVAFHLAAATGLRRGELLGLRWCDVDHAARELHVVQALVEVAHEVRISVPKTERSRRLVALDGKTCELLAQHRRAAVASRVAETQDHNLVFSTERGDPIHPALFSYYFQRRVRLAGVQRIRFHDLRHTHATHALQAGVHPKVVSERLGHSTITVTLDTYSHVLPGMQREAAEAVAALVHE